jgi:hypothetical protein
MNIDEEYVRSDWKKIRQILVNLISKLHNTTQCDKIRLQTIKCRTIIVAIDSKRFL